MKIGLKLLLWEVQFRLSRIKNNDRIEYLTRKLLDELKDQGYNIGSATNVEFLTIFKFEDGEVHIDSNEDVDLYFKLKENDK